MNILRCAIHSIICTYYHTCMCERVRVIKNISTFERYENKIVNSTAFNAVFVRFPFVWMVIMFFMRIDVAVGNDCT